jgi:PAS domain S-box-containing protein
MKPWQADVVAILTTMAAFGLRAALDDELDGQPTLVIFTLPVMLSAYLGGLRAGLLATLLSCLGACYYLLPPIRSFLVASVAERWNLFFILLAGAFLSVLSETLHRALRRADQANLECQRAAAAWREGEGRLRAIIKTQPECMKVVSSQGRLLEMNPAGLEMLQAGSLEEAQRKLLAEYIAPEYRDAFLDLHRRVLAGESGVLEFEAIGLKGCRRWLETHATALRNSAGQIESLLGITRDITERKEAEKKLIASEKSLAAAQALVHLGSWELDLATRTGCYSAEMFCLFYQNPVLGATAFADFVELVHPEDRPVFEQALTRSAEAMEPCTIEYRTHPSLGPVRHLSAMINVVRDGAGRPVRMNGTTLDITAHKLGKEAAIRLAAIVESSEDAIIGKNLSGVVTSWNPGAEKLFGYPAFEMIGQPIMQLVPPDRQEEEVRILALVGQGVTVRHFETVRVRKDGSTLDVSVTISAVKDAVGKIIGASKVAHDIRAEKRTERALGASELRYRRLFESAQDGILILDAETGMVVDVNPFLMKLLGCSYEQFLGKAIWELGFFRDILANEDHFAELKAKQYIRYEHLPLETCDGQRIEVEFVSNVYLVEDAKVIQCNIRDVTERQRAEAARRESEERFQMMANSIPQLAWIARADGYIFWYNQRWYEYTGTTPEHAGGGDWQSVHDPEVLPAVMEGWKDALATGKPWDMEFPLRGADGQFRTFLTRVRPVKDREGRVLQWFGTNTDVEAMKQAEGKIAQLNADLEKRVSERTAQLAAANTELEALSTAVLRDLRVAEAADKIKSAFLATMSHELRTPLNSILGFTGIVLQGMAGPLNPEQTKQLGMVRASARHLLALINDVLDLSKIEAGQLEVHGEPFNLRAALEHVVSSIQPLADRKSLALTAAISPDLAEIVGDRRRVEQILLNFLSNAVKFTERGSVTLTAGIVADFQPSPNAVPRAVVCIEVADTGMGIKPEDLATLFQPFRQIDTGLARQNEGTGLGLAISRRLATLLGGEIFAASKWSTGSAFTLALPFKVPFNP